MKIRTTLFSLIIAALFSVTAFAQNGGDPTLTPEQRIEKLLAHAQKQLNLTDDQVAKLKAILKQNQAKIKADRQSMRAAQPGPAKQDARKQLMTDAKSMRDQMKTV